MALFKSNPAGLPDAGGESANELLLPADAHPRLRRVMAFCGLTWDDLRTCEIARRRVAFYLGVDREVGRRAEIADLERQWNPLGRHE